MEAVCKTCNKSKPKSEFVKNQLLCKECAAAKQRIKINCSVCSKLISYGNMSKHLYSHNKNNPLKEQVVCECGTTICKYSLHKHLLSKKHLKLV
jgi:hypothetical protein